MYDFLDEGNCTKDHDFLRREDLPIIFIIKIYMVNIMFPNRTKMRCLAPCFIAGAKYFRFVLSFYYNQEITLCIHATCSGLLLTLLNFAELKPAGALPG